MLTDRRDLVIDRLSSDYAHGRFEVDELEHRLALAHSAQTAVELDALVTDLVPAATASVALVPLQKTRVVFGSIERTGPWAVPPRLAASVVCGHLLLDLREARLAPGETTIDVRVLMGNVEVIVPPGVEVEVSASSFLGSAEERVERGERVERVASRAARVRIVGHVRLGNLEVETRRPGETRRDVRRRADRRAYRRWQRARDPWRW